MAPTGERIIIIRTKCIRWQLPRIIRDIRVKIHRDVIER